MKKELQKQENALAQDMPVNQLEKFAALLNNEPHTSAVFKNPHAGNSLYLPISVIEKKLDELFFGLWQTRNFSWQVITNEIVGHLELGVFHPVAKTWVWREGAGAVLIQQKKGSSIDDVSAKIKNTLVKDFPHLKAQCLKNAALSLGPIFGRNLNRDYWEEYEPITKQQEAAGKASEQIEQCTTKAQLDALLKANKDWWSNETIYNLVLKKRKQVA